MPHTLLAFGLTSWLSLLAILILFRMLNGEILVSGLLRTRIADPIDPERILMLVGTVVAAIYYASLALSQDLSAIDGSVSLPPVQDVVLQLLGGSQVLYLAGKIARKI